MAWRREPDALRLLEDERGQSASEYALLIFWTVIIVIVSVQVVEAALFNYYRDTAALICLPIP